MHMSVYVLQEKRVEGLAFHHLFQESKVSDEDDEKKGRDTDVAKDERCKPEEEFLPLNINFTLMMMKGIEKEVQEKREVQNKNLLQVKKGWSISSLRIRKRWFGRFPSSSSLFQFLCSVSSVD